MFDTQWKPAYETGHVRIDFEHRIFLDLIRQIGEQILLDAPHERIVRTITEFYKYADFHFYSEETLMLDIDYPDFESHKSVHASLLNELRKFIASVSIDSIRGEEMVMFLVSWFSNHTVGEDTKLAGFTSCHQY